MKVKEFNQLLEQIPCDAAALLGVKESTLHRWVTGKKPIPDHYINLLKREIAHAEGEKGRTQSEILHHSSGGSGKSVLSEL
jgi:hypothetical protein